MHEVFAHALIVGAGHAGGSAAAVLRQYGWKGPITLVGAEPIPPYQRPPLSKAWLAGGSDLASLLLRPAAFYAANAITLRLSSLVTDIDRANRSLSLDTGESIAYDHLILALGAQARMLSVPGRDLVGVFELRTMADADRTQGDATAGPPTYDHRCRLHRTGGRRVRSRHRRRCHRDRAGVTRAGAGGLPAALGFLSATP